MLRNFGFLVFIFLLFTEVVVAQQDDWGVWTALDVEKKLNKRWDAVAGFEYRTKDGIDITDQIRSSLGLKFNPKKFPFKFDAGYTLIADKKQKRDIFVYRHRFQLSATGSYKFDRFTASWRPRLQATFFSEDDKKADEMNDYRWVMRNRFGLKYNIKKTPFKPYIQYEFFNRFLSDLSPSYYKNRFSTGIEINIGKKQELDIGYKRDNEVKNNKNHRFDVIAAGYKLLF